MFGLSLFSLGMTGNVINDSNAHVFSIAEIIIGVLLVLTCAYALYSWISGKIRNNKFDKHSQIIDNFLLAKRIRK